MQYYSNEKFLKTIVKLKVPSLCNMMATFCCIVNIGRCYSILILPCRTSSLPSGRQFVWKVFVMHIWLYIGIRNFHILTTITVINAYYFLVVLFWSSYFFFFFSTRSTSMVGCYYCIVPFLLSTTTSITIKGRTSHRMGRDVQSV